MLNMIETFFFISLAITFVLILLLVYHFKQRFTTLEQKTETMFDIVNNIVSEISIIRRQIFSQPANILEPSSTEQIHLVEQNNQNVQYDISDKLVVSDSDDETDADSDDESDADSDDESDEDSVADSNDVSDTDSDDEPDINDIDENSVKIVNVDMDDMKINETNIIEPLQEEGYSSNEEQGVPVVNNDIEPIIVDKIEPTEDYNKMTLTALRKLIISKELHSDPSKMKKAELIAALNQ